MVIRVNKPGFKPVSKTVTFGYTPEEYDEIFGRATHTFHFYPTKNESEFLVCVNEIERDQKVGTLKVLDMKKAGNQTLVNRALTLDYGLTESEYEIIFV